MQITAIRKKQLTPPDVVFGVILPGEFFEYQGHLFLRVPVSDVLHCDVGFPSCSLRAQGPPGGVVHFQADTPVLLVENMEISYQLKDLRGK